METERSYRRKVLLEKANEIYTRAHPAQDIKGIMADLAEWALDNPREISEDKGSGGWTGETEIEK